MFGPGEAAETRAPDGAGPVFAARLDGDGALLWARFAGGGVPGQGYGVAHDRRGAVAVTGYVNGVAAFGNDVSGAPVSIDPAMGRAFVARWDVAGRLLWAQPIGGPAGEGDAIADRGRWRHRRGGPVPGAGAVRRGRRRRRRCSRIHRDARALSARRSRRAARRCGRAGSSVSAFIPGACAPRPDGELLVAGSFGGGVVLDPDGAAPADHLCEREHGRVVRAPRRGWRAALGDRGRRARRRAGADFTGARDGTTWAVGTYHGPATFGAGAAFGAGTAVTLDSGTDGGSFLLRVLAPAP